MLIEDRAKALSLWVSLAVELLGHASHASTCPEPATAFDHDRRTGLSALSTCVPLHALVLVMAHYRSFDDRFDVLAGLSYRVAFRLTGDRHVAEDLAQETLARAFQRWRKIQTYDEAWTVRVTTNLAIGRWRRRSDQDHQIEVGAAADTGLADRLDLIRALQQLPKRQREVVALRYLADLSEAQIADQLGCSRGSVKQHAHRGLASLRQKLDQHVLEPNERPATDATEEESCV